MPDIAIDPEAVQSARIAMLTVRDTLNGLHAQYERVAGHTERTLWEAATELLDSLNPLHMFDAFGVWDRRGFGGIAHSFSSTRGALEEARSTTDHIVERLCDAHQGPLATLLREQASHLRSALNAALDSLWTITALLNPGNLRRLIENPGSILEHSAQVRNALGRACTEAQNLVDFLTRLHAREQSVIDDLMRKLPQTVPSLAGSLQGSSVTIQGDSSLLQGSSGYLQGLQPPVPSRDSNNSSFSQSAAENAKMLEHYLTTSSSDKDSPHNGIDIDALVNSYPPDQRDRVRKLVDALFQRDPDNWLKSDGTPDVQCVAFVALVYAITTGNPDFLPAKGNANELWAGYAHNAVPGWKEIDNKAGSTDWPPQVGDMVPMIYGDNGHVAIVTHVDFDDNGNVTSIDIAQGNSSFLIETLTVQNGVVQARPDHTIQGFIRYTGQ